MPSYSIEYKKVFDYIKNENSSNKINIILSPSWNLPLLNYYITNKDISYIAINLSGKIESIKYFNPCLENYYIISENTEITDKF